MSPHPVAGAPPHRSSRAHAPWVTCAKCGSSRKPVIRRRATISGLGSEARLCQPLFVVKRQREINKKKMQGGSGFQSNICQKLYFFNTRTTCDQTRVPIPKPIVCNKASEKRQTKKLNKTTKMHQNEIGEKITRHRPQKGPSFEWRPSRWRQPTLRHPTRRQGFWETFPFGLGKTHGTGVGWRVGLG